MTPPSQDNPRPPGNSPGSKTGALARRAVRGVVAGIMEGTGRDDGTRVRWSDQAAHSRRVRKAKVALPALAGVALLMVAVWPAVQETTQPRKGDPTAGQVAMADAHYLGIDKHGRPVELRAAAAEQVNAGSPAAPTGGAPGPAKPGPPPPDEVYNLTSPETEIILKSGQWVTLKSDSGIYDRTTGHLSMRGHVTLTHDKGYEFTTASAEVDTLSGQAWGNDRVAGQGSFGDIDAGGFRVGKDGDTVVFTGKARLRLFEAARRSGGLHESPPPSSSERREGAPR